MALGQYSNRRQLYRYLRFYRTIRNCGDWCPHNCGRCSRKLAVEAEKVARVPTIGRRRWKRSQPVYSHFELIVDLARRASVMKSPRRVRRDMSSDGDEV